MGLLFEWGWPHLKQGCRNKKKLTGNIFAPSWQQERFKCIFEKKITFLVILLKKPTITLQMCTGGNIFFKNSLIIAK